MEETSFQGPVRYVVRTRPVEGHPDEWAKAVSPMSGRLGCREFRLTYDSDYGIDHRSGWSVVVDGSVVAELMDTPEAALKQAAERVSKWDPPRCCSAHQTRQSADR